jgi:predicted DNA-binding transcriptional regulator AlpA
MPMIDSNVLETPEEVARRIKRPESWLAKARSGGFGPRFLKIGGSIRYRRSDVDTWLQSCARSSTADTAPIAA